MVLQLLHNTINFGSLFYQFIKGMFMKTMLLCCIYYYMMHHALHLTAQTVTPEISSWLLNTTGLKGYNGISANVQKVQYSSGSVYVNATGIPAYNIGPWSGNPNTAANKNFTFKIPRIPQVNSGTKTTTPLGYIGVMINGIPIYNARDGRSYQNQNVWNQEAFLSEGDTFDKCAGHPDQGSNYHHHLNPGCLYTASSSKHSPIVGFAFDGYPVYGAYANKNADGTGGITRMRSSYRLRSITQRTTYANGSTVAAGPAVSAQYPLGTYIEDYEYAQTLGDLDAYNGRFAVTPEYPKGTYAYYVTIDESGKAVYPYLIGPQYYGVATTTGMAAGFASITEPVTNYTGQATDIQSDASPVTISIFPNPTRDKIIIKGKLTEKTHSVTISTTLGQTVRSWNNLNFGGENEFSLQDIPNGTYLVSVSSELKKESIFITLNR